MKHAQYHKQQQSNKKIDHRQKFISFYKVRILANPVILKKISHFTKYLILVCL